MTLYDARRLLASGIAIALLAASCGGGESRKPTQSAITKATQTPTTSTPRAPAATTSPTVGSTPLGAPSATAAATMIVSSSTAPPQGGGPTSAPEPTPPPRASSVSLTIRAANLAFDTSIVRVPAGATVTATLQNDDAGVQHNLAFSLPGLAHGETCTGPCTETQTFTATPAGSYFFLCTIHDMVGTFVVEP